MKISSDPSFFPDGTPIDPWFSDLSVPYEAIVPSEAAGPYGATGFSEIYASSASTGVMYFLNDYNILPENRIQTKEIQALIDRISCEGGGTLAVPSGIFRTGALDLKSGVNLYLDEGAVLMGSDDISDYPLRMTRIEGQTCLYFPALINAEGLDHLTIWGPGTIDGNGLRFWKGFWQRRAWNPACTNKDEQRPRLLYLSDCSHITISGLHLQNSAFWTTHIYHSDHIRILNCRMYSPAFPVKAPSTDGLDIDACSDVLVSGCRMHVNDDGIALKGGKGPWADRQPENGANERIIIENNTFDFCYGVLTFGSESIHDRNIIFRRNIVHKGHHLIWLKMRPDTPQLYEYAQIRDVKACVASFLNVNPWSQFFDLKGRKDLSASVCRNFEITDCECVCDTFFNVLPDPQHYVLSNFTLRNLKITAADITFHPEYIRDISYENLALTKTEIRNFEGVATTVLAENEEI